MGDKRRRSRTFEVVAPRSRGNDPVVFERVGDVTAPSEKKARATLKALIAMGAFPKDAVLQQENPT